MLVGQFVSRSDDEAMKKEGNFIGEESTIRLSAFLDVLQALISETDLNRFFELLIREAREILDAEDAHLFLLDEEKKELYCQPPWGREVRFPLGKGISGDVVSQKTLISAPLKGRGGRVLGVLQVFGKKDGAFSNEDERLFSLLASYGAMVIENFQLDRDLRISLERVSKLLAVSQTVNAEIDLDSLLTIIAESASSLLKADRSTIFLIDKDKGELWSRIAMGLEKQEIRLKLNEGIVGEVVNTGKTINIKDAYEDSRFNREIDQRTGYTTRSILCMPMRNKKGEIIGVFQVLNKKGETFNEEDERLLDAFSSQAGIAIENSQLYEEVKRAYNELRELDQMKSNFLANISHELRTPLTPVMGYVETLLSGELGPLSSEQKRGLEVVFKCVDRLKGLIEDLLAFVRVDQGEVELKKWPVIIQELLKRRGEAFAHKAQEKGLELRFEIPSDLPEVWADEEELGRAISLLLDNALKFTPQGGSVTIAASLVHGPGTTDPGRLVEISVRDTGIGIPAQELSKIFDRFYQVDSSPTRKYGGTGIGLSLIKQIIEAHGSRIFVESEVGKGTTFYFRLPVVESKEKDGASPPRDGGIRKEGNEF